MHLETISFILKGYLLTEVISSGPVTTLTQRHQLILVLRQSGRYCLYPGQYNNGSELVPSKASQ